MILYLNGSPKNKKSNSESFLKDIKAQDTKYLYKDNFEGILKNIRVFTTIIFSFPLYVDSPPSKVIEFMEYIENNNINIKNKNIYVIVNCGFLESKHNNTACEIIKNFCFNTGAIYKGAFKIGAGEIIGKRKSSLLFRILSLAYNYKINIFKNFISNNEDIELSTTIHPMTKRLYVFIVNMSFKSKIKKNNAINNKKRNISIP